jgi:hypothetical protein
LGALPIVDTSKVKSILPWVVLGLGACWLLSKKR